MTLSFECIQFRKLSSHYSPTCLGFSWRLLKYIYLKTSKQNVTLMSSKLLLDFFLAASKIHLYLLTITLERKERKETIY